MHMGSTATKTTRTSLPVSLAPPKNFENSPRGCEEKMIVDRYSNTTRYPNTTHPRFWLEKLASHSSIENLQ